MIVDMTKMVVLFDLDGTLIDSSHRVRYKNNGEFDLDYWIETSKKWEKVKKDKLLPLAELYKEFKKTGFSLICVTARNMQEADFRYLKENELEFEMILHRGDSLELDEVLKSQKLKAFFEENDRIPFMAYDDKQENLEVFDKFGFRTFHATYMNKKLENEKKIKPKDFV